MSIMWKIIWGRYEVWEYGLKMLAFVLLVAVLPPAAIATFFTMGLELILYVFGIKSFALSNYYNNIFFVSFVVFGPYYVGKEWDNIADLAKKLRSELDKPDN